jgi:hypothetical protein
VRIIDTLVRHGVCMQHRVWVGIMGPPPPLLYRVVELVIGPRGALRPHPRAHAPVHVMERTFFSCRSERRAISALCRWSAYACSWCTWQGPKERG